MQLARPKDLQVSSCLEIKRQQGSVKATSDGNGTKTPKPAYRAGAGASKVRFAPMLSAARIVRAHPRSARHYPHVSPMPFQRAWSHPGLLGIQLTDGMAHSGVCTPGLTLFNPDIHPARCPRGGESPQHRHSNLHCALASCLACCEAIRHGPGKGFNASSALALRLCTAYASSSARWTAPARLACSIQINDRLGLYCNHVPRYRRAHNRILLRSKVRQGKFALT